MCPTRVKEPLQQGAYVWQREWSAAVSEAVNNPIPDLNPIVVLGAEIEWNGANARIIRSDIQWDVLRACGKKCGIALRVASFPGSWATDGPQFRAVATETRRLLAESEEQNLGIEEFQLDFDCAAGRLTEYAGWVRALREVVRPTPFVITTLPAWLESEKFSVLVKNCDSYILQVHSVPLLHAASNWKLCDPGLARKWVAQAASYHKPFSVALPTYRCIAGYTPNGQMLGVAMDSTQGRWPPDTSIREVAADPDELADLVAEWRTNRPRELRRILWYRLPISSDSRNWRYATFAAVTSGRRPRHALEVLHQGSDLVDLAIQNTGEADEKVFGRVVIEADRSVVAADSLAGWSVDTVSNRATFARAGGVPLELRCGETRNIGWLRFAGAPNVRTELLK